MYILSRLPNWGTCFLGVGVCLLSFLTDMQTLGLSRRKWGAGGTESTAVCGKCRDACHQGTKVMLPHLHPY